MKNIKLFSGYLKNNFFIRTCRVSTSFTLLFMLSGCCCLWYVDVEKPEIYNTKENKVMANKIINSAAKEDTKEQNKIQK